MAIASAVSSGLEVVASAVPHFWLASLLILVFSTELGLLPPVSTGTPAGLVLPVVTLAIPVAGFLGQVTRDSLLDAAATPFDPATLVAAFGCTLGTVPHLLAAITGTAALLQASGLAFQVVKVLGVAYLLHLAWSTWRDTSVLSVEPDPTARSAAKVIRTAVLINLLNPKLTLFFFAFLPQFVNPAAGGVAAQFVALGLVSVALNTLVGLMVAYAAGRLRARVGQRSGLVRGLRQASGAAMIALGLSLLLTRRPA